MAELMGSAGASFFYAHLILKRGGADKAIPWHQDLPYWKVGGTQIGSVWVALDDMPRAASVKYIKGGGSLIGRILVEGDTYSPAILIMSSLSTSKTCCRLTGISQVGHVPAPAFCGLLPLRGKRYATTARHRQGT